MTTSPESTTESFAKEKLVCSTLTLRTTTVRTVDQEIIKKGNQKHRITELDRLSFVVSQIERDCAIVPYQSQKSILTGELMPNVGYSGQTPEDIGKLTSYRHYRDADEKVKMRIHGIIRLP